MKKILALTMALVLVLSLGACGKAPAAETKAPTEAPVSVTEKVTETEAARPHFDKLTLEFVPSKDADVIIAGTENLPELVKAEMANLGYDIDEVDITVGTSYDATGEAMSAGTIDLGWLPGGTYALYSDDTEVILTATRNGLSNDSENPADWNGEANATKKDGPQVTYYRSLIYATPSPYGKELAAKVNAGEELTWDDLNSATWSVLSPTSASGYIYPCLWLQDHYGKGISDLEHVVQSDSHTTSVARLAAGQVDVMVSFGHIRIKNAPKWESELGGTAPMVEQTGVIGVTEGIYNDMIAYSKNSDTMADEDFRKALGESFIEIADTDEGREIISVFSQVGYTWGQDSDYDGERAAQELLKSLEG